MEVELLSVNNKVADSKIEKQPNANAIKIKMHWDFST
jgi:hypothetical protein